MKKEGHTKLKNRKLLSISIQSAEDKARFNEILDNEHYLGARMPSGNTVYEVICDEAGEWVAVALWCGAGYRLDPRDVYIGWDMKKREERLGLVVQLARFALVRADPGFNMASYAMGCALRGVCGHYLEAYGYEPALAESFSDPELHAGTVYRATNWEKLGMTKGFPRCKKNRDIWVAPSRKTFDTVLQKVSPSKLAAALDAFYAHALADLPETLAVDGKYVRDKAGTLNVCDVHGRTLSSVPIKKRKEPPTAREALKGIGKLDGVLVTGEAGNCSLATASEIYRLLDPGSEWRMHREWFRNTAMADLLGCDGSVASKNTLYRCLAKLCKHKDEPP
jgi:hypothetical protein